MLAEASLVGIAVSVVLAHDSNRNIMPHLVRAVVDDV